MISDKEIEYYRSNITDKYVIEVHTMLAADERINKRKYATRLKLEKLFKSNPNYKKCNICGKYKRLTDFYKNPIKKQGVFDYCKECTKKLVKINKERKRNDKRIEF